MKIEELSKLAVGSKIAWKRADDNFNIGTFYKMTANGKVMAQTVMKNFVYLKPESCYLQTKEILEQWAKSRDNLKEENSDIEKLIQSPDPDYQEDEEEFVEEVFKGN